MGRNIGYLTAKKTALSDECYTPEYAVKPIIEFINNKFKCVWCPFDTKNSEFVKVLKKNGFEVIHTHISDKKNFLTSKEPKKYDVIISNPPYSIKDKVIEKCYKLNKPFMLLLPLPALQGKNRYKFFSKGLELLVFDGRVSYYANGSVDKPQKGNSFASCYFCKGVLPKQIVFRRLEDKND